MSNYTKATDFASKDALLSGDPSKIIKGTEIDTEFNSISTAISTKADLVSPTFTGTPLAPTAAPGTNTTQVATTAFVTAADIAERTATATLTNKTLTSPTINTATITGGSVTGITDLTVADGGTGVSALTADNVILGDGTNPVKFVAPSTSGNVLTSNGTTWASAALPAAITRATAQASTSGTSIDFTGIPSTAKRITILLNGVSTSGSSDLILQLGDSGGVETTGYTGYWWISASYRGTLSSGVNLNGLNVAASATYGQIVVSLFDSNLWSFSSVSTDAASALGQLCAGVKTLSGTLDRIRLTTANGTDTFDAGSINILYE